MHRLPLFAFLCVTTLLLIPSCDSAENVVQNADFFLSSSIVEIDLEWDVGSSVPTSYPFGIRFRNFPDRKVKLSKVFFQAFSTLPADVDILLSNGDLSILLWSGCLPNCTFTGEYALVLREFRASDEFDPKSASDVAQLLLSGRPPRINATNATAPELQSCFSLDENSTALPDSQYVGTICDDDALPFPAPSPPYVSNAQDDAATLGVVDSTKINFVDSLWNLYVHHRGLEEIAGMRQLDLQLSLLVDDSDEPSLSAGDIGIVTASSFVALVMLMCLCCCIIVCLVGIYLCTTVGVGIFINRREKKNKPAFPIANYEASSRDVTHSTVRSSSPLGSNVDGDDDDGRSSACEDHEAGVFIRWDDIELREKVGSGAFGMVYRGKWHGADVAVKRLHITSVNAAEMDVAAIAELKAEARILKSLGNHPHVLKYIGTSMADYGGVALVTEYCMGGSLWDAIVRTTRYEKSLRSGGVSVGEDVEARSHHSHHRHDASFSSPPLSPPPQEGVRGPHTRPCIDLSTTGVLALARQAAAGILHLHKSGVVHRDIATRNMLLNNTGQILISDFGLARAASEGTYGHTESNIGPVRWMAPEAIRFQKYSQKSDSFSFGVALWEMCVRKVPWGERLPIEVAVCVAKGKRLIVPRGVDEALRGIMKDCWKKKPEDRPDFSSILNRLTDRLMELEPSRKQSVLPHSTSVDSFTSSSPSSSSSNASSELLMEVAGSAAMVGYDDVVGYDGMQMADVDKRMVKSSSSSSSSTSSTSSTSSSS